MYEYEAEVRRVVDADTLDLLVDLGMGVMRKQRVRLARVNAWETRGSERQDGLLAKARVEELCPLGSTVTINTKKAGKYNRYIAEVWLKGAVPVDKLPREGNPVEMRNLGDILLAEGHARLYGE